MPGAEGVLAVVGAGSAETVPEACGTATCVAGIAKDSNEEAS
ncbi:hypothetical protein [Tautonia rosea]|nr:hypothetical protein [Tautonia rosea]